MKFLQDFRYKTFSIIILGLLLLLVSIIFVDKKTNQKSLSNIVINIKNEYQNYFVDEREVLKLISNEDKELLINKNYDSINLKKLEKRILTNHFVQDAQVSRDWKGNLVVEVEQCKPIARIIPKDGMGAYLSDQGELLNTSEKFTARVVLIDGEYTKKLMETDFFHSELGQSYKEFLDYVHQDPFWKALFAQITIDRYGEMTITPQIGSEVIDFGTPENFELKLEKLNIFYKKILPTQGWSTYKIIKLKFKDQIVCEKPSGTMS